MLMINFALDASECHREISQWQFLGTYCTNLFQEWYRYCTAAVFLPKEWTVDPPDPVLWDTNTYPWIISPGQ